MTINYNSNSLIIGYIKEFLHEFNLPKCKIYTKDLKAIDGQLYIKEDKLCKYYNGKFIDVLNYNYGDEITDLTKNLIINSSVYDNYTHAYLGDYLRFLRDYKGVNLMPFYNCFLYEEPYRLNITGKLIINTDDLKYNYYLIPVRFDQSYTIAIDATSNYEIACMYYTGEEVSELSKTLIGNTYKKCWSTYKNPILYKTPSSSSDNIIYEKTLKLILKIPKTIKSSITILEGNYLSNVYNFIIPELVINEEDVEGINYPTKLSLLDHNTHTSYPFSDRLIEYLLGNVITPIESISDNIYRVQEALYKDKTWKGFAGIWDKYIPYNIYTNLINTGIRPKVADLSFYNGSDYTTVNRSLSNLDINNDLLMYVDKDVESIIGS